MAVAVAGCKDSKAPTPIPSEGIGVDTVSVSDAQAAEMQRAEESPNGVQEKLVREFYRKYVFGNEPMKSDVLSHYCSDRMIQMLKDKYDYADGGGYAVWLFRSGMQDGPSRESRITSVTPVSQVCLEVSFVDMGNEGSHKIYFIPDGDSWRIDRIG